MVMKTGEQLFGAIMGQDQLEITPCLGRKISTALADWHNGKDFYSCHGYLSCHNIADIQYMGYNYIRIVDRSRTVAILLEI